MIDVSAVFHREDATNSGERSGRAIPLILVRSGQEEAATSQLSPIARAWVANVGFKAAPKRHVLVPDAEGGIAAVLLGVGDGETGEPCGPAALLVGHLASQLPAGVYALASDDTDLELAAVAWGLGAYRFRAYKSGEEAPRARLAVPASIDRARLVAITQALWLGRDLINTPPNDMGPEELEGAARAVATRFGATVESIVGADLLARGFTMIHAVGRASSRAPRLVDLRWGREGAPRVTLVGKGICFDTGGLDIKPASNMLLMKKDMGGAAAALALGHVVMALGLDVRLRILLAVAENAISGDAFRPSDVIRTRSGLTVEIGNTDAEGRLVLSDALSLGDEETPDLLVSLATLTGAARVALGPDLAPLYTDDEALARDLVHAGRTVGDPVWPMPFWPGYERALDSEVADLGNVSEGSFAGSIIAALFLRRFVKRARRFAHLDIYGWRPAARALGPKGGEPQAVRALLQVIERMARGEA